MIAASFILVTLILWKTYEFFQHFKEEERVKMENWSFAQTDLINSNTNANLDLTLKVLNSNTTTPMLVINEDGGLASYNNIDDDEIKDSLYVKKLILKFQQENKPISVKLGKNVVSTIYYGNSP